MDTISELTFEQETKVSQTGLGSTSQVTMRQLQTEPNTYSTTSFFYSIEGELHVSP